jgi:2-polyprenyl-3-methyl-5-hydroxy-6-metoxy-1,4-benzoquinol methylase
MELLGERIIPDKIKTVEEYVIFLKHMFAYDWSKNKLEVGMNVLEVGSGEGYGTSILSSTNAHLIGVDVDRITIDNANYKYGSENCKYQLYDGKQLPFPDGKFDVVVSFQVIEHVQNDIAFLNEIKRVMKDGGVLYLATPNRNYRLRANQKPWNCFHIREYSQVDFAKLLKDTFETYKLYGVTASPVVKAVETRRVYANKFRRPISVVIRKYQQLRRLFGLSRNISINKAQSKFSIKDFLLVEAGIGDALDLFAVCIKDASKVHSKLKHISAKSTKE